MKQNRKNGKRICSACLAFLTAAALALCPMPVTAEDTFLPGDVNGDGEVTVMDVIIMQGWLLGHDNVSIYEPQNSDVNQDGTADVFDLALMKRILTGGGTSVPVPPKSDGGGKLYQKIGLTDQYAGIVAYEGILPEGWTAEIESVWDNVNPYPGQEFVTFVSPDKKATIQIASRQEYEEGSDRGYGTDISNFITLMPYMPAAQLLDNEIMNLYPDAEFVKAIEIPEQQQKDLDSYTESYYQTGIRNAQTVSRYPITPIGAEGTAARRQYKLGDAYVECSCSVSAFQYGYTKVMLNITETWWTPLNTVTYAAKDKEAFDKYYDDYEMITANGYFTAAFYSANAYVNYQIVQMMTEFRTRYYMEQAAGNYNDSGTPITDSDRETQERVFQMWDDYIREEDRYTTADGGQLITSMYNQTVAQDGDKFYVGDTLGVPDGYSVLTKQ